MEKNWNIVVGLWTAIRNTVAQHKSLSFSWQHFAQHKSLSFSWQHFAQHKSLSFSWQRL